GGPRKLASLRQRNYPRAMLRAFVVTTLVALWLSATAVRAQREPPPAPSPPAAPPTGGTSPPPPAEPIAAPPRETPPPRPRRPVRGPAERGGPVPGPATRR